MSLKKEVFNEIDERQNELLLNTDIINITISIFEKRIDEMINHIKKLQNSMDKVDPLKEYQCYRAILISLDKLKEMLK